MKIATEGQNMTADKKVFSLQNDRYKVFETAKEWMRLFMTQDEAKGMNHSEIVRSVLEDIMSGRIGEAEIEKLKKEKFKGKGESKTEEKAKESKKA